MKGRPSKYRTFALDFPMSWIELNLYVSGSNIRTCGLMSSVARTEIVGCLAKYWTSSSVGTKQKKIDGSWYIVAVNGANPVNGPPARASTLTPVLPSGPE